jgi:hypothetical protein
VLTLSINGTTVVTSRHVDAKSVILLQASASSWMAAPMVESDRGSQLVDEFYRYANPGVVAGEVYSVTLYSFMTTWVDLYVQVDISY